MTHDIKKILDEIDGLREKTTSGKWEALSTLSVFIDGIPYGYDGNEEYIIALQNNYPLIRDYITRLERESEAGKACAEGVRQMIIKPRAHNDCLKSCCRDWDKECQSVFLAYRSACEGEEK